MRAGQYDLSITLTEHFTSITTNETEWLVVLPLVAETVFLQFLHVTSFLINVLFTKCVQMMDMDGAVTLQLKQ